VIASGGAGRLEDFHEALAEGGASAVLAASLFHFGQYKISEVKDYLRAQGIVMR
jgi:imidazole glycerol phosphate synthase subunit HisF